MKQKYSIERKKKEIILPIKNNDSTLILMKFEKMKEQLVGFKVFRKSKSIKKKGIQLQF
jgi:hypothetical protein